MDDRNTDEELPDLYEDPDEDFDDDDVDDDDPDGGDLADEDFADEDLEDFADYTDEQQDKPKVEHVKGDIDDLAPDLANAPVLEPPD